MIKVGVGISQKWDPADAAAEAAAIAEEKNSTSPSFVFVFTTIEYEVNDGFRKILTNIKRKFNAPIVGGTVGGFMNNDGIFSHGVAIMILTIENANIIPFFAENTKRNPINAARVIAEIIKRSENKKFSNKIIIDFLPGPTIPSLPVINTINFVNSTQIGGLLAKFGLPISSFLGYGIAKDDILLQELRTLLPGYYLIGGATMDNGKLIKNFQFYDTKISTKMAVGICIETNETISLAGTLEMDQTAIKFNVTKTSQDGTVIDEIDNKPAFEVLKDKLNLKDNVFKNRHLLYRTTLYYPLSTSQDIESSTIIGAIYGSKLLIGHRLKENNITLLSANGLRVLQTPERLSQYFSMESKFIFAAACETGFEAIGSKIYKQKEKLDQLVSGKPYLIVYFAGEHYSLPNEKVNVRSHSFNVFTMG